MPSSPGEKTPAITIKADSSDGVGFSFFQTRRLAGFSFGTHMNWLKSHRVWVFGVIGALVFAFFALAAWDQFVEQLRTLVGFMLAAGPVYLIRKALIPGNSKQAFERAMNGSLSAAIVWAAIAVFSALALLAIANRAPAAELPPGAIKYMPVLQSEINTRWRDNSMPSVLCSQVWQESLWKTGAHLHTGREDGYGLGQFTVAYNRNGSVRFDALAEARALDPVGLADFTVANAFNPKLQLRAVVLKNRINYWDLRSLVKDDYNAFAMMDAAYNSGIGSVYARRRLCSDHKDCDNNIWFANLEFYSTQSRAKWRGYGLSAFDITNQHVVNVMIKRLPPCAKAMGA